MTRITCLSVLSLLLVAPQAAAVSRFNVTLDGGTQFVTVDNASSFTDSWISSRVLAADRSTQDDCDFTQPDYKGLFKTGDRVFASDHYMAWFDMTVNDGIHFGNPPYGALWPGSGALAGWWTLNAGGDFKYKVTGPNGCNDWAPNEIIPGSASPNQEQHWWDKYAAPTEHSIQVVVGNDRYFFGHHLSQAASNGQWNLTQDGVVDASGNVRYKTTARLASLGVYQVDVTDNNDANGISNYIESEMEYVCQPKRVLVIWKLKPKNSFVVTDNLFIYVWLNYAQDKDGQGKCDPGGAGSQWPGTSYRNFLYAESPNMDIRTSYDVPGQPAGAQRGPFPPGTVVPMVLGPNTCPENQGKTHENQNLFTRPAFQVVDKSALIVGESPTIAKSKPRFRMRSLDTPNAGTGTQGNPIRIDWDRLIFWNETFDGTLGFGLTRGPYTDPSKYKTFQAGLWYQAKFELRSKF